MAFFDILDLKSSTDSLVKDVMSLRQLIRMAWWNLFIMRRLSMVVNQPCQSSGSPAEIFSLSFWMNACKLTLNKWLLSKSFKSSNCVYTSCLCFSCYSYFSCIVALFSSLLNRFNFAGNFFFFAWNYYSSTSSSPSCFSSSSSISCLFLRYGSRTRLLSGLT